MTEGAKKSWRLVLGSGSPRRAELLSSVGLEFAVEVSWVPEIPTLGESPKAYALRLANAKASAVQTALPADEFAQSVVIGADTVVALGDTLLEKPHDKADALRMWTLLSGTTHEVISAVSVVSATGSASTAVSTQVSFIDITPAQMQAYWSSGEPHDKAGAYAIQGLASAWVKRIQGSFSNVVGLPLFETNRLLTPYALNWL